MRLHARLAIGLASWALVLVLLGWAPAAVALTQPMPPLPQDAQESPPPPATQAQAAPQDPAYQGLFPAAQSKGDLRVELHPDARVVNKVVVAGFGVPFPPGFVRDPRMIALIDNTGKEMPISVRVLATWHAPVPHAGSIRAAFIQYRDLMSSTVPRAYTVRWGAPRQANVSREWSAREDWLPVEDGTYPAAVVLDPPVYAVLPGEWLGKCLLKGRMRPAGQDPKWEFYDNALRNFFPAAINKAHANVGPKFLSHYLTDYEPWLFDRATTFFLTYFRLGGLQALREAHRAAQYYAYQIQEDGKFALLGDKLARDPKFGYQECLALDHWLTGDDRVMRASRRVLNLLDAWDPVLTPARTFWTERHLAFNLLNATTAYEMTGDPALLARARFLFEAGYNVQLNPEEGAPRDGCMVHSTQQHGERKRPGWICSPWMSAQLVDAMLRYYIVSADPRVAKSVEMLADFMVKHGTYRKQYSKNVDEYQVPYYLMSSDPPTTGLENYFFNDLEHAIECVKIIAVAQYFVRKAGGGNQDYDYLTQELIRSGAWCFERWRVKNAIKSDRPEYPLVPMRKYNWWFRTTVDLDWLLNPS